MDGVTPLAAHDAAEEPTAGGSSKRSPRNQAMAGGGGGVYGLGLIGASIYFFRSAETRRDYVLAIPKGIVWPAVLVYDLLKAFHH